MQISLLGTCNSVNVSNQQTLPKIMQKYVIAVNNFFQQSAFKFY